MSTDLQKPEEELREHFFKLKTRQDVADLLEISDYQLRYHLYISPKKAYTTFTIPKKSGESRIIHTPVTPLKIIQKKLNQVLRCVYQPKPSTHALPFPQHRQEVKDLCIELYYRDSEIQRKDGEGRRLFLSNEFRSRSGRHKSLDLNTDRNKIKGEQIKIIDSDVFDREDKNVALSKNSFADYILRGEEGFNDFDFEEFVEVFKTIDNIIKFHIENDGISS